MERTSRSRWIEKQAAISCVLDHRMNWTETSIGCEADSWGFWLYFAERMARTFWRRTWYDTLGFEVRASMKAYDMAPVALPASVASAEV